LMNMAWARLFGNSLADPWWDLRDFYRDLSPVLGRSRGADGSSFPAINIYTRAEGAVVTAEVPGVKPEDLDISVEGNILTIRGARTTGLKENEVTYHRQERPTGSFARTVRLPFSAEPGKVEAKFQRGTLRVIVPIAEKDKPRRITVKTA